MEYRHITVYEFVTFLWQNLISHKGFLQKIQVGGPFILIL